jgi:hypothetical protein
VAALVLASVALAVARGAPSTYAAPAFTFNPNLQLPTSSGAAEPSIRTDSHGTAFVIGPTGVPGGCKAFRISHDGSTGTYLGQPDHQAGGGDCDWAIGPQESAVSGATDDDLAYSSLTAANITVGKSDNGGTTFGPPNPGAAQVGGDDRMWMAADPRLNSVGFDTVYMSYHDVTVGNIEVSLSVDGGQTYVQSTPLINATEVPQGQWEAAGAGNELGNIVARRSASGLTLYSIFETPDSANDNVCQSQAGTSNFNRVYEAVGTVADTTPYPTVTWQDYEIFHGLAQVYAAGTCPGSSPVVQTPGARYNRIFPVTTVDQAGHVYAVWADGKHIDFKADKTGTGWNPAAQPLALDTVAKGYPTTNNTAVMPWAQAGANGIVDVVWYGAHGGSGAQPNPQDDPHNVWNTYFAQTTNGGVSWQAATASDHVIHSGPICLDGLNCNLSTPARDRTLLDFFQVSLNPTNGAADIAYADDHASPGSAVIYFTRQCTGTSATTGKSLKSDCVAPPPPPTPPAMSTCPGPQVADFTGDAPNNYPGGDGANMENFDIVQATFASPNASTLQVTLMLKNLAAPPPPLNLVSAFWTVYWTYNGTTYFAQATSNGSGSTAVISYSVGTYSNGSFTVTNTISGTFTPGADGTIGYTVPLADVGNQPSGAALTNTYADTHGSFTVNGTGVFYSAAADRAPDANYGANWTVGTVC